MAETIINRRPIKSLSELHSNRSRPQQHPPGQPQPRESRQPQQKEQQSQHDTSISLQELVFQELKWPSTLLIQGPTGSGKTEITRALVRFAAINNQLDRVIVICPTADPEQGDYSWVPKDNLFIHPSLDLLKDLIQNQEDNKQIRTLFILDDMSSDESISLHKCKPLINFVTKMRHYKASCIIITHDLKLVSPTIRSQAKVIITTFISEHSLKCAFGWWSRNRLFSENEFKSFVNNNVQYDDPNRPRVALVMYNTGTPKPYRLFQTEMAPKFVIKECNTPSP